MGAFLFKDELISEGSPKAMLRNRAFLYADGLFETIRWRKGRMPLLSSHLARLTAGMRYLQIDVPFNFTEKYLIEQLGRLIEANGIGEDARIRVTVFRDSGG